MHRPVYNVIVSNVPGPPMPLYMHGAELVAFYPHGPIFEGTGLNITVMSYQDSVDIGVIACRRVRARRRADHRGISPRRSTA